MIGIVEICLAAMFHGVIQGAVLLTMPRGNKAANATLAFFVLLIVISMWNAYVGLTGLPVHYKLVNYYLWGAAFLWGPTLYLYVGTISAQFQLSRRIWIKHCALAVVLIASQIPIHILNKNGWLTIWQLDAINIGTAILLYAQLVVYFYWCFKMLHKYEKALKDNFSQIDKLTLKWLTRLTILFALVIVIDFLLYALTFVDDSFAGFFHYYLIAEVFCVFAIGYFSIFHQEVIFPPELDVLEPATAPLEITVTQDLEKRLNTVMHEAHAYKKNDLRLAELANMTGVRRQVLSQFINENLGKNYYEFVNELRVTAAAAELEADDKANIEKVAFDVGFSNRVSFYNAFKKLKGQTPTEYRNRYRDGTVGSKREQTTA